ncbi:MAG TPA: rhodanese-like domain-containing protein [Polyangiaceae bacterium]|nr:rhodanese-like domain-containing protein [Polyangiaceae bacterium]
MSLVEYRRLNAEEALKLIFSAHEREQPYTLFDARDAHSYGHGRVPGALPLDEHQVSAWVEKLPRAQPVFIYCNYGLSSQTFAKRFADAGFAEVYSVDGGFSALVQALERARAASTK